MTLESSARRTRRAGLALLASVALLQGCDPCAGYAACVEEPHVSYSGRAVVRQTGESVASAEILFVRTGGVALERDTIAARSNGDGFFLLDGRALEEGDVTGSLLVHPPDRGGYRVDGLTLTTTTRPGDGGQLGRVVVDPYTVFVGLFTERSTGRTLPGARVTWRRTGGIMATPADTVLTATAEALVVIVFRGETHGIIEGEFTVQAPGRGPFAAAPVRISTDWTDRTPYLTTVQLDAVDPQVSGSK